MSSAEGFVEAAGEDGPWIIAITEDRNISDRYTLTAPRSIIRSPNARIQGGMFAGDVLVEADGFLIVDATVEGDVTFASSEYRGSARIEDGSVTGEITVE